MGCVQAFDGVSRVLSVSGCARTVLNGGQSLPTEMTDALLMCRDHILNIKDAPAPKPAGKGAKRTLEQATAAPPSTAAASVQPPQEAPAAAQTPAEAPAVEAEQPSDGQDTKEQPAAQERIPLDAAEPQLPGLAQEKAQASTSEPQADGDAAASTTTVSVLFSRYVGLWLKRSWVGSIWLHAFSNELVCTTCHSAWTSSSSCIMY